MRLLCARARDMCCRKDGGLVLGTQGSVPDISRTLRENSFLL